MNNQEKFEECLSKFDPDQSLTLADEYPHYASYVTCMAANMFEARQKEIDDLKFDRMVTRSLYSNASREIERLRIELADVKREISVMKER